LDVWLGQYNNERTHSGKYCYGKTPMRTFVDSIPLAREKPEKPGDLGRYHRMGGSGIPYGINDGGFIGRRGGNGEQNGFRFEFADPAAIVNSESRRF